MSEGKILKRLERLELRRKRVGSKKESAGEAIEKRGEIGGMQVYQKSHQSRMEKENRLLCKKTGSLLKMPNKGKATLEMTTSGRRYHRVGVYRAQYLEGRVPRRELSEKKNFGGSHYTRSPGKTGETERGASPRKTDGVGQEDVRPARHLKKKKVRFTEGRNRRCGAAHHGGSRAGERPPCDYLERRVEGSGVSTGSERPGPRDVQSMVEDQIQKFTWRT